jgi:hypothetical protein
MALITLALGRSKSSLTGFAKGHLALRDWLAGD